MIIKSFFFSLMLTQMTCASWTLSSARLDIYFNFYLCAQALRWGWRFRKEWLGLITLCCAALLKLYSVRPASVYFLASGVRKWMRKKLRLDFKCFGWSARQQQQQAQHGRESEGQWKKETEKFQMLPRVLVAYIRHVIWISDSLGRPKFKEQNVK